MLNDGLKQSNRLIIDKPNLTDAYMKRIIRQRIKGGQAIEEIWIKEDSEIRILYKKSEEWLLIPHSGEESVVISYGILVAKVQKNPRIWQLMGKIYKSLT